MVTCFDVCEILEMLSEASVKVFLDGGWGVDALIGRETRTHNDIDLFVEKKDYCITISVMTGKGYREVIMDYTTDSHTVWKDDNGRIIDMHCFEYVEDGILYDGYIFPSETFSGKGKIGKVYPLYRIPSSTYSKQCRSIILPLSSFQTVWLSVV